MGKCMIFAKAIKVILFNFYYKDTLIFGESGLAIEILPWGGDMSPPIGGGQSLPGVGFSHKFSRHFLGTHSFKNGRLRTP